MPSYSFRIPGPPGIPPIVAPPVGVGGATMRSGFGAVLDLLINPVTLDYYRTDDGAWVETADSRTAMLIQLESEYAASPWNPGDGTRIKAMLREGEPVSLDILQAETLRAGKVLQAEGILSDLTAEVRDSLGNPLVDETGRSLVRLHWRDLIAGSPVDLVVRLTGA